MAHHDTRHSPTPERWTAFSIALHWAIVVLLAAQFAEGEWMSEWFDSTAADPADATTTAFGIVHMVAGAAIFLAAALRLWDRFAHGRPPYPAGEPAWANALARTVHAALYTLLLAMPPLGAAAWFTGDERLGDIHAWGWTVLMLFAALHVAGALVNHFWFRTPALTRMLPGQGR